MTEALYKPLRGQIRAGIASPLAQSEAGYSSPPLVADWVYDGTKWVEVASVEGWELMQALAIEFA